MPSTIKSILIDTNIIIHLEDNKKIEYRYSELSRLCSSYGIKIYIHEASYEDILRDKDTERRNIAISKLEKYEQNKKKKKSLDP